MSKGNSNLFHGTFGTSVSGFTQPLESYSDRGIEIPKHVKDMLENLPRKGDYIKGKTTDFSMADVSIMSKETGVEYAKVTIGNDSYLIRGDEKGATIPTELENRMKKNNSSFDFHSHPHNDDLCPSPDDIISIRKIERITGQKYSAIVAPNGRTVLYNSRGVISAGIVETHIDEAYKKDLIRLFGGTIDD